MLPAHFLNDCPIFRRTLARLAFLAGDLSSRPCTARAAVREAWLVDVEADRVEAYRRPSREGYEDIRILERGETLAAEAFPDVVLTVDDLLD